MKNYSIKTSLFCSLFVLFLFSQCAQHSADYEVDKPSVASAESVADAKSSQPASAPIQPNQTSTANSETTIERMLTKEGTLVWETSDINKTHAAIITEAKKYNAYISNDEQTRNEYQTATKIILRIPSDKFDDFVSTIEKEVTKFDEKNIEVLDVTAEFIDISARLKTKKELEQHYYDLLKQTKNVTEVLQVEAQLDIVRGDIESAEGRIKYLKDKVSMSTLNLNFYETTSAPVGFFGEIGKSFVSGWKGFLYFILGIINIWPIALVFSIVIFLVIRQTRKKK